MAKASFFLLFSTLNRRDVCLLIPAIVLAALSGVVPTLMAKIIGEAFNAFAYFNPNNLPASEVTQESKEVLREAIYRAVWQLCSLGGATMVLSTVMISLWIVVGEKVARGWRVKVYKGFDAKDMAWFEHDLKEKAGQEQGSGSVGAGGIMAKFARETDEVRIASGQVFGQSLETLATIVSSLLLALLSCWSLTLVILASIPLTAALVGFVQSKALPLHENEMENMARASNILERCIQSITTIKAFATEARERSLFMEHVDKATQAWHQLALIYGGRLGLNATLTLVMFTSGFWYGSMLVQQGKTTPGSVITTFWSCLLIGNSLGTIMSTLNLIEVGKVSAGSLVDLISEGKREAAPLREVRVCSATPPSVSSSLQAHPWQEFSDNKPLPLTPSSTAATSTKTMQQHQSRRPIVPMRKIRPSQPLQGEVNIQGLTFSYPSRPTEPVLQDVSMFFPAGELTFIVGGSGSGKSTLSHLLLRLYDDYVGEILLDDQDIRYLDAEWSRSHIAALDQSAIIFDMSVSDNIALGRCGTSYSSVAGSASKANHVPYVDLPLIVDACKMALLHNDIQQLDEGYNTLLGAGGIDLSGGQKQRLALARAIIRDPPVLILDECTSALDVKSRTLITAFIKQWRRGKTTIMITHDLSQVEEDDFVYFLEKGKLVEQGYRSDLTANEDALFSQYVRSQTGVLRGGTVGDDLHSDSEVGKQEEPAEKMELCGSPTGLEWRASTALKRWSQVSTARLGNSHARASRWGADASFDARPLSRMNPLGPLIPSEKMLKHGKQDSISSISSDSTVSSSGGLRMLQLPQVQQLRQIQKEEARDTLELASVIASIRRPELRSRKAWDDDELYSQIAPPAQHQWSFSSTKEAKKPTRFWRSDTEGYISEREEGHCTKITTSKRERRTLMSALRMAWTTQPKKGVLSLGLLVTVIGGGVQPAFSFILGKLLATMGRAGQQELVLQYSLVVLGLAFIDGIANSARFALLQYSANVWIRSLRFRAFSKVFSQDKAWFDREENSSSALLTKIIKDGEDAKSFVSRIIGELLLVIALVTTAFTWSLIVSWQLTLVGAIMVPVFYGVVVVQSRLINRFERQNKLQRERVSKRFYNMLHNIRGIRSMSLEIVFWENFHDAVRWVEQYGVRSAPLSGFGYGLKDACISFAQALLYIVGSYLLIEGKLELSGMLIVLNLLLFAVSFAAEVLAYLPGIAKSMQSIYDLVTILTLEESSSSESSGCAMPHISGSIHFRKVDFTYPTRPHDKVLDGCTFDIHSGERVALVGQSGCGKSTIASLVSRMYEPDGGVILLDDSSVKLGEIQTQHLRSKLAFVQQRSDLFDDSIRNNILYGNPQATPAQLERALKTSCSHEIVEQLQDGLDTNIGDTTSSTISGGQKQRLALARALVRDEAKILLLDECTSALDPQTQEKVAENLLTKVPTRRLANKTLLVITHKLEMMKRCDRILVLDKGKVVQSGHFNTLISQKGGVFSKLANAGEWGA